MRVIRPIPITPHEKGSEDTMANEPKVSFHDGNRPGTVLVMASGDNPDAVVAKLRERAAIQSYTGNSSMRPKVEASRTGTQVLACGEGGNLDLVVAEMETRILALA